MGIRPPYPPTIQPTVRSPSAVGLSVSGTFAQAFRIYRLLFRRSVTVAAAVFGATALIDALHHLSSGALAALLAVAAFVFQQAGPVWVQGALVEIVRNVHEGSRPEGVEALFVTSRRRFWPFWASLVYVFGVFFGALLLLIPGFIVAARWSLFAPLVVLEGRTVAEARHRSSELVKGQTVEVLLCVVITYLVAASVTWLVFFTAGFTVALIATFVWNVLTAPLVAHVFTVIYYRLSDPGRPVIDPRVAGWQSVWEGR